MKNNTHIYRGLVLIFFQKSLCLIIQENNYDKNVKLIEQDINIVMPYLFSYINHYTANHQKDKKQGN